MRKMWLIASKTYRERVRSGMFLILTFGIPVLMIIVGAVGFFTARPDQGDVPAAIGVVDQTGELATVEEVALQEEAVGLDVTLNITDYTTTEAAENAYLAGEIGGYLVVPEGYFEGQAVTYHSDEEAGTVVEEGLRLYMQRALLSEQPDWIFERLDDPATYTYAAQGTGEAVSEGPGLIIRVVTPIVLAIAFIFAVLFGTTQMGAAIIQEKDQRAMEMIVTSMRPVELVAGKIAGMTLLSLTQFTIWIAGGAIALFLAFSDQFSLQQLSIPWTILIWGLLLIVPGYFLFAVLAAGLGILAGDSQQAQQLAGALSFLGLAPIYLMAAIFSNPEGPLAVGLTLFPLTAPSIALMRSVFFEVPTWQMAGAVAILLASLAFSIWLVTRLFRAAMLNYGKLLRPKEIWRALVQA